MALPCFLVRRACGLGGEGSGVSNAEGSGGGGEWGEEVLYLWRRKGPLEISISYPSYREMTINQKTKRKPKQLRRRMDEKNNMFETEQKEKVKVPTEIR